MADAAATWSDLGIPFAAGPVSPPALVSRQTGHPARPGLSARSSDGHPAVGPALSHGCHPSQAWPASIHRARGAPYTGRGMAGQAASQSRSGCQGQAGCRGEPVKRWHAGKEAGEVDGGKMHGRVDGADDDGRKFERSRDLLAEVPGWGDTPQRLEATSTGLTKHNHPHASCPPAPCAYPDRSAGLVGARATVVATLDQA